MRWFHTICPWSPGYWHNQCYHIHKMPLLPFHKCKLLRCRYHSLCAYMGDDDMFSSDLSDDQLRMRLGHMSNTPCQVQMPAWILVWIQHTCVVYFNMKRYFIQYFHELKSQVFHYNFRRAFLCNYLNCIITNKLVGMYL